MRFYVITVLPELLGSFVANGLVGKAVASGTIEIVPITPRDFTKDRHRTIDDAPYGGGSGMLMMPGPLVDAMESADAREAARGEQGERPLRILLTPQGEPFTQRTARELASAPKALTLVCGRYEGVDERARTKCDREISIGDFVLMGGEVGAMAVIEAVSRLLPGVLGNATSIDEESHSHGRLEYPHYTRPASFRGEGVPEVLIGGHHAHVAKWRKREALRRTLQRRPDLLEAFPPDAEERKMLDELRAELAARDDGGET
ncbi:MAG: tRNA (guanosine(37)-N1)-methyltransferase TrmD [Myxococcota bacterium]|nr:tRNA (guanosine(37)-N1)-methyltransferase TrmD [Myxococcota bacterium]